MNRIRVLQIVPSLLNGGAERLVIQLTMALHRVGVEVAVCSLYGKQGTPLEAFAGSSGLKVWYLGKRRGFDPRAFYRVAEAVKEFGPHLIHTHLHALMYSIPSALFYSKVKVVHTVHSAAERERQRIGKWTSRMLFRQGVMPVAVAKDVQTSVRRVFRADSVLIPNGIPIEVYNEPSTLRDEWRARQGFRKDDVLFVSVARFDNVKNHKLLIQAFKAGPAEFRNAHLLLAGDGDLNQQLRTQVRSIGLYDRVHFLGVRSDIPDLLGACDVFVSSSDYEGSPLSMMEAMAAGLPIVGTAVGGIPEMVPNGSAGFLVTRGDCRMLAEAMGRLYAAPTLRAEMAKTASKCACRFDIKTMAVSYVDLYKRLLGLPVT